MISKQKFIIPLIVLLTFCLMTAGMAQTQEKCKDLLNKAAAASGGMAVLSNIRNMQADMHLTQVSPGGEVSSTAKMLIVYPDKLYGHISMPQGDVEMTLSGDGGWIKTNQGTVDMPELYKKSFRESIWRDPFMMFHNLNTLNYKYIGIKDLEGKKAHEIQVSYPNYTFTLFLDQETHLPAGYRYIDMGMNGSPEEKTEIISDYQKVSGCLLPMKTVSLVNGKKESSTTVTEYRLNVSVESGRFFKN